MEPTDNQTLTALDDEQIKRLAVIVLDEFGPGLDWKRFDDVALLLFEDVPGFELMTPRQLGSYLRAMWIQYRLVIKSDHTH